MVLSIKDPDAIALRCAVMLVIDDGAEDDILGYDEHGLPT